MPNEYNKLAECIKYHKPLELKNISNLKKQNINNLFQLAIRYKRIEMIQLLLGLFPELNKGDNCSKSFRNACAIGSLPIAQMLYKQNPKLDIFQNNGSIIKATITHKRHNTFTWLDSLLDETLKSCISNLKKIELIKLKLDLFALYNKYFIHNYDNKFLEILHFIKEELHSDEISEKYRYYLINIVNENIVDVCNHSLILSKDNYSLTKYLFKTFLPYFMPDSIEKIYLNSCEHNNIKLMKLVLNKTNNKQLNFDSIEKGLLLAVKHKHTHIIKYLLEICYIKKDSQVYEYAVSSENIDFILMILDVQYIPYSQHYPNLIRYTLYTWSFKMCNNIILKIINKDVSDEIIQIFISIFKYFKYYGIEDVLSKYITIIKIHPHDLSLCSFDATCAICCDVHQYDTKNYLEYIRLNCCNHVFGKKCIEQSILYGNKRCPLCRADIFKKTMV